MALTDWSRHYCKSWITSIVRTESKKKPKKLHILFSREPLVPPNFEFELFDLVGVSSLLEEGVHRVTVLVQHIAPQSVFCTVMTLLAWRILWFQLWMRLRGPIREQWDDRKGHLRGVFVSVSFTFTPVWSRILPRVISSKIGTQERRTSAGALMWLWFVQIMLGAVCTTVCRLSHYLVTGNRWVETWGDAIHLGWVWGSDHFVFGGGVCV